MQLGMDSALAMLALGGMVLGVTLLMVIRGLRAR